MNRYEQEQYVYFEEMKGYSFPNILRLNDLFNNIKKRIISEYGNGSLTSKRLKENLDYFRLTFKVNGVGMAIVFQKNNGMCNYKVECKNKDIYQSVRNFLDDVIMGL